MKASSMNEERVALMQSSYGAVDSAQDINIPVNDSRVLNESKSSNRWISLLSLSLAIVIGTILVVTNSTSGLSVFNRSQTQLNEKVFTFYTPGVTKDTVSTMVLPTDRPLAGAGTTIVQTVAGNGAVGLPVDESIATATFAGYPRDLVVDSSNNILYCDDNSKTVRIIYAASGRTYTLAGVFNVAGNSGDGGAATSAVFSNPYGLSFDKDGNLLVTDVGVHVVRKITMSSKIVTRVAGTGSASYNGDGGAATSATLYSPYGAVSDGSGNVFIGDFNNCRVRRVGTDGKISTYAGTGSCSAGADAIAASSSPVYYPTKPTFNSGYSGLFFGEWSSHRIRRVTVSSGVITTVAGTVNSGAYSGDGGQATSARLNSPMKIVFDSSGGYYIADRSNSVIRYVTSSGVISTYAGIGGTPSFNQDYLDATLTTLYYPEGVAIDQNGFVLVSDTTNYRIRGIYSKSPTPTPTRSPTVSASLVVQTVVGNGAASYPIDEASAVRYPGGTPRDVLFDSNNNLYYADDMSSTVRVVYASSGISYTYAGTYRNAGNSGDGGAATAAKVGAVYGLNWDSNGNMLIADQSNHVIRRITTSSSIISRVAGTGGAGYSGDALPITSSAIYSPFNAISDSSSANVYISDFSNCRVRRVNSGYLYNWVGSGGCSAQADGYSGVAATMFNPARITLDKTYTYMYVAEWSSHRIRRITMSTLLVTTVVGTSAGYGGDGGLAISANIYNPRKVVLDSKNGMYIADYSNQVIRYVSPEGLISTFAGTNSAGFNQDGLAPTATKLYNPEAVAIDVNGFVYVADVSNYRIRGIFSTAPTSIPTRSPTAAANVFYVQTVAGSGSSYFPVDDTAAAYVPAGYIRDIIFDGKNNLYYAEDRAFTVRVVNATTGVGMTYAGTSRLQGNTGDGGAITSCTFINPYGISWDIDGNMLVADAGAHVIRRINFKLRTIARVAGTGSYGYNGDSVAATSATLYSPYNAISDGSGNVFISDFNNCRVRKVSGGTTYTFAGNGGCASNDDGLQATNSNLYYVGRIAFDASYSFLYIPEWASHRVRKVNVATGIISTVAGVINSAAYSGDGGLAISARLYNPRSVRIDNNGGIYIADYSNSVIRYVTKEGIITSIAGTGTAGFNQDGIDPLSTKLYNPESMALDNNGLVYIADLNNYRVRGIFTSFPTFKPTLSPTSATRLTVRTVVGNGGTTPPIDEAVATKTPGGSPHDILFDSYNNLYYTEVQSSTVRVVYASSGLTYTFAGGYRIAGNSGDGGQATAARFSTPYGISWDLTNANMYVTDWGYHTVRSISMSTKIITKLAGTGSAGYTADGVAATGSALSNPFNAIPDGSGNIFVSDFSNCRIRRITGGFLWNVVGNGGCSSGDDGLQATNTPLYNPAKIAFDSSFNYLYIPEWSSHRIRRVSRSTGVMLTIAGVTNSAGYSGDGSNGVGSLLYNPREVTVDSVGGLYIADYNNHAVRYLTTQNIISTYAGTGTAGFIQDNLAPTLTRFYNPTATGIDWYGNIVICDLSNYRIRGVYQRAPTASPTTLPTRNAWVSVMQTGAGTGATTNPVDGLNALSTPAGTPRDIIFDATNNLYYADDLSKTVRVIYAATGLTYTFAGKVGTAGNTGDGGDATSSTLSSPYGLSWDTNGDMLIADAGVHCIRRVTTSSKTISRVAGTGSYGYNSDGLAATSTTFYTPMNAIGDQKQPMNIYVSDFNNCRIRRIYNGAVYTFAGNGGCASSDDGLQATNSNLYYVGRLSFDNSYNHILFPEWSSHRIRKVTISTGIITTVAGRTNSAGWSGDGGLATDAQLYNPRSVKVDQSGGFYITDYSNQAIRYVTKPGIISTIAGVIQTAGFNQDGISPLLCRLNNPEAVMWDKYELLYIADTSNYRLRRVFSDRPYTDWPTSRPTSRPTAPTPNPTSIPTFKPSRVPTLLPTPRPSSFSPTSKPTKVPTPAPSSIPTAFPPTKWPTPWPTSKPSKDPTPAPSAKPSSYSPTARPSSYAPTAKPSTAKPSKNPTLEPTPKPSSWSPTSKPTKSPTDYPTAKPSSWSPTARPSTAKPTKAPTDEPTSKPSTGKPSKTPTLEPTPKPSSWSPTSKPTKSPTEEPTAKPSSYAPSAKPSTAKPTKTDKPTKKPITPPTAKPSSIAPTSKPTKAPTDEPTSKPSTGKPSKSPTSEPTVKPTKMPTEYPTAKPSSFAPSARPTREPTEYPTRKPTTAKPSRKPSIEPSAKPTKAPTEFPTAKPSKSTKPTKAPSEFPTTKPTSYAPTTKPTKFPTEYPTTKPSPFPTGKPTAGMPSFKPTSYAPTTRPTAEPTGKPTKNPTSEPTTKPSSWAPTTKPSSFAPSTRPTREPTSLPTKNPTPEPTSKPSSYAPTAKPSSWAPTAKPSSYAPTAKPSSWAPTSKPTTEPTARPTKQPTEYPTAKPTTYPPTAKPSSFAPTAKPSSFAPTAKPSSWAPTAKPSSWSPSAKPTKFPTEYPSAKPSSYHPTIKPTGYPKTPRPSSPPSTKRPTSPPRPTREPTAAS